MLFTIAVVLIGTALIVVPEWIKRRKFDSSKLSFDTGLKPGQKSCTVELSTEDGKTVPGEFNMVMLTQAEADELCRKDEAKKHIPPVGKFSTDEDLERIKTFGWSIHSNTKLMDGNDDNWHEEDYIRNEVKGLIELLDVIHEARITRKAGLYGTS